MTERQAVYGHKIHMSISDKIVIFVLILSLLVIMSVILIISIMSLIRVKKLAPIPREYTTTSRSTLAGTLPAQISHCGSPNIQPPIDGEFLNPDSNTEYRKRERIVNGQNSLSNSWPWLVSIRIVHKSKLSSHLCGGSLIYESAILTAAHCIYGYSPSQLVVIAGVHTFNSSLIEYSSVYYVSDFFYHPEFDTKKIINDIAILKLTRPVKNTTKISTICLPKSSDPSVLFDKNVIAAGWGSTSGKNKEKDLAQTLQQTVLKVKNGNSICGESDKNYCAIGINYSSNTCYGDSGSPLMYYNNKKWYVYGLTSFILSDNSTCMTALPSYYTVVPSYLHWIGNVATTMKIS